MIQTRSASPDSTRATKLAVLFFFRHAQRPSHFLLLFRFRLWMFLRKYLCLRVVPMPYSPQTSCSLVTDMDGVIELASTHILQSFMPRFHIISIYPSFSLVVVFVLCVSQFRLFCLVACLIVCVCVRACLRALARWGRWA